MHYKWFFTHNCISKIHRWKITHSTQQPGGSPISSGHLLASDNTQCQDNSRSGCRRLYCGLCRLWGLDNYDQHNQHDRPSLVKRLLNNPYYFTMNYSKFWLFYISSTLLGYTLIHFCLLCYYFLLYHNKKKDIIVRQYNRKESEHFRESI